MSEELEGISEEMSRLAVRGAVLAAKEGVGELNEILDFEIDLRSFLAGGIARAVAETPVPAEVAVPAIMEQFEAEIARLDLEKETEGAFDDLPVFDPGNGS